MLESQRRRGLKRGTAVWASSQGNDLSQKRALGRKGPGRKFGSAQGEARAFDLQLDAELLESSGRSTDLAAHDRRLCAQWREPQGPDPRLELCRQPFLSELAGCVEIEQPLSVQSVWRKRAQLQILRARVEGKRAPGPTSRNLRSAATPDRCWRSYGEPIPGVDGVNRACRQGRVEQLTCRPAQRQLDARGGSSRNSSFPSTPSALSARSGAKSRTSKLATRH